MGTMRPRWRWAVAAMALAAAAGGWRATEAGEGAADEPRLRPGRDTRVELAEVGGHIMVYVPADYTRDRSWPLIFCYHGQNGRPTSWPFKEVTDGRGFIVVGMGYQKPPAERMTTRQFDAYVASEVAAMRAAGAYVARRLNVDRKRLFIGGFSKGGWSTSTIAEASLGTWAGICILGAGRHRFHLPLRQPRGIRGKPIYIGVGQRDTNRPHGESGAKFYRKAGARVTYEEYPGLGHQMKTDSRVLREWLRELGYLKGTKSQLAAARRAETAGRLGRAYTLYHQLAQLSDTNAACLAAAKGAKAIVQKAEERLAEAERAVAGERHAEAIKLLLELSTRYEGSDFGDRAKRCLETLPSSPAVRDALRRAKVDAEAEPLEAEAAAAESARNFDKAIRLYRQYLEKFPKATRAAAVRKTLAALRSQQAGRHCRVWLNLADNYIRAGRADRAKPYLKKIIDRYGDTDWADGARRRLRKLGAASP